MGSDKVSTVQDLIKRLEDRYGSANQTAIYRAQLKFKRRGRNETLGEVVNDIRRLMVLAYPGPFSPINEAYASEAFLEALNDREFANKIREKDPTTLEQAFQWALRYESIQGPPMDRKQHFVRQMKRTQIDDAGSPSEVKIEDIGKQLNQVLHEVKEIRNLSKTVPPQFTETKDTRQDARYNSNRKRSEPERHRVAYPSKSKCMHCGMTGHWRNTCPKLNNNDSRNNNNDQEFKNTKSDNKQLIQNKSYQILGVKSAYIKVEIRGRKRMALLDTGSELSLIPESFVPLNRIRRSTRSVRAANGSNITVQGECKLRMKIGNQWRKLRCIVVREVGQLLLGLDWMQENLNEWDFGKRQIKIGGEYIKLVSSDGQDCCRRIEIATPVQIPAHSEALIKGRTIYNNWSQCNATLMTETRSLPNGLLVARTLVEDKTNVMVRVANPNSYPLYLKSQQRLCNVEETELLEEAEKDAGGQKILQSMIDGISTNVSSKAKDELIQLINKYKNIFSLSTFDLGRTDLIRHRIDTAQEKPFRQALRNQPLAMQEEINQNIKEMLDAKLIGPTQSPWASNVVVVRKKDGSIRFCVDYRQLNAKTIKDVYPLPRIDHCLDQLAGAVWFSTFDLRAGYHQVTLDPRDAHKTAFITRQGCFEFKVLPFGLCNAPATFERLMDFVLRGLNYEICLCYLDDIIVFSTDETSHLQRLETVFNRLREAGLKLKPTKCHLFQEKVIFLGYEVSKHGIFTDSAKIEAVRDWPQPKSVRDVRSFLGLASYYRRFVPDFATTAEALHKLTHKNMKFKWSEECQSAFLKLKSCLEQAPTLTLPTNKDEYILDTDASDVGLGVVLAVIRDGLEYPVAYASRLCSLSERNYNVTRRELLAIIFGVKLFRQYLWGRPFTIRTDHSALQWMKKTPEPIGQQARWLEILEEFDYTIKHRPGRHHQNADSLSRRNMEDVELEADKGDTVHKERAKSVAYNIGFIMKNIDPIHELQRDDIEVGRIYQIVKNNLNVTMQEIAEESSATKFYLAQKANLIIIDEILYYRSYDKKKKKERTRIVLPASLRRKFMTEVHAGFQGGHFGSRKTVEKARDKAFWFNMKSDVTAVCKACEACNTYHRGHLRKQGELQRMRVGAPMERWGIDLTGPHPQSAAGHKYILTAIDYFTRYAEAWPLRNQEAKSIVEVLTRDIFTKYGVPREILTDRGTNFESEIFSEMCTTLGVYKLRTSGYKASTNGMVERFHRTLNMMLGKMVAKNHRNWHTLLPHVMAAYRATPHEATGVTPNRAFFGREAQGPIDLMFNPARTLTTIPEHLEEMVEETMEAYDFVTQELNSNAKRHKIYYDRGLKEKKFQVGQLVYIWKPKRAAGRNPKWERCYSGPYVITAITGPVNYRVKRGAQEIIVHVDKMKEYIIPPEDEEQNENIDQNVEVATGVKRRENSDTTSRRNVMNPVVRASGRDRRRPVTLKNFV